MLNGIFSWTWHPVDVHQSALWMSWSGKGANLAERRAEAIRLGMKFWILTFQGIPFVVEFFHAGAPAIIMHGAMCEKYEVRLRLLDEIQRRSAFPNARPVTDRDAGRFYVEAMMMTSDQVTSLVDDYLQNTPNHGIRL